MGNCCIASKVKPVMASPLDSDRTTMTDEEVQLEEIYQKREQAKLKGGDAVKNLHIPRHLLEKLNRMIKPTDDFYKHYKVKQLIG